jgi:hypothetical protein
LANWWQLVLLASLAPAPVGVCIWGLWLAFKALRFSRLLRRPSDPRTATVTASKDDGRTLILDIIPRDGTGSGYQSLSEVRLALWLKAGMLVPGETVNVYGVRQMKRTANQQPPVGQGVPRHGREPVDPPVQTARREG